eukprot:TRINITY_DN8107_c1_g1_i2.p1 TRINITY_DN8107_c1_g1~~TRINITY_DN8107_c1_g1_i2.p1  ORF type:complete len:354 (+),score=91.95 TRINITY_DN8107_c1_g1_i2:72-1064(+)
MPPPAAGGTCGAGWCEAQPPASHAEAAAQNGGGWPLSPQAVLWLTLVGVFAAAALARAARSLRASAAAQRLGATAAGALRRAASARGGSAHLPAPAEHGGGGGAGPQRSAMQRSPAPAEQPPRRQASTRAAAASAALPRSDESEPRADLPDLSAHSMGSAMPSRSFDRADKELVLSVPQQSGPAAAGVEGAAQLRFGGGAALISPPGATPDAVAAACSAPAAERGASPAAPPPSLPSAAATAAEAAALAAEAAIRRRSDDGSCSDSGGSPRLPGEGQTVEVRRSDGSWHQGTVRAVDRAGGFVLVVGNDTKGQYEKRIKLKQWWLKMRVL